MKGSVSIDKREEIIKLCLEKDSNNLSYSQIGNLFNLSKDAVRGVFRRWKVNIDNEANDNSKPNSNEINLINQEIPEIPENKLFNQNQFDLQKIRQEKNEIRKYMREHVTFDNIIRDIKESIKSLPSLSLPEFKLIQDENNNEKVLVVVISDLHIGQISDLSLNLFDHKILTSRLHKYFQEVKSIAKFHGVKKITICFAGDLIEGYDIYKGIIDYSDLDPISQVIKTSEVLSRLINNLSNDFIINIHCSIGNHGRLTGLRNSANFERLILEFIRIRLEYNDNVTIFPSNDYLYSIVNVLGYKFLLIHDGNMRNDNSALKLKEIMGTYNHNIYEIIVGHLHHSFEKELFSNGQGVICCGSFVGGSDFSISKLQSFSKASQTCFIVEKDKGRFGTYKIILN